MYNLSSLGVTHLMKLRADMRSLFDGEEESIEEAAQRVVRFFRETFVADDGTASFLLARVYKTHRYDQLDPDLQAFASRLQPDADAVRDLRCLVLVATAGEQPEWNERHLSRGHRAIPLSSEKAVEEAPMIAQLIRQLGVSVANVLRPAPGLMLEVGETAHNVFYVPNAEGSPYIVAQDEFVRPHGIRSVIGFGGMVATGDLFASVLFSKTPISADAADLFKVVGLNFKLGMLSVARKPLFAAEAQDR